MQATVTFVAKPGDANQGKIRVSFSDNGTPVMSGSLGASVKIVAPNGVTIKDFPGGSDGTFTAGTSLATYNACDIPFDSDSKWMKGVYTISFRVTGSGGPLTGTTTYDYQPKSDYRVGVNTVTGGLSMALMPNCASGLFRIQDNTNYTGWTISTLRSGTILIPDVPVTGTVTDTFTISTGVVFQEVQLTYASANWFVTLTTVLSKSTVKTDAGQISQVTFVDSETLFASDSVFVLCESGLCGTVNCLQAEYDRIDALACANGGWSRVPAVELAKLVRADTLGNLFRLYLQCGNYVAANDALVQMKASLDCDCGCSDSSDQPYIYTAPNFYS